MHLSHHSKPLTYRRPASASVRVKVAQVQAPAAHISSLQEVLHDKAYAAVLLDQFGVLHDGREPYPGAIHAVEQLSKAGCKVFIISNSSRRVGGTISKLEKMGFKGDWFAGAMTSGEVAHQMLASRPCDWWRSLGKRVLHFTWSSRGTIDLSGLNLEVVDWPEEADFILAHGTEAVGSAWGRPPRDMPMEKLRQMLVRCAWTSRMRQARRDTPLAMVVANPDICTVDGPNLIDMPGALARTYQQLGGSVRLMGKPDPIIYQACLEQLGMQGQPHQVLAIGDSIEHDIGGAAAAGIDSLFVVEGIHAAELQYTPAHQQGQQQQQGENQHQQQQDGQGAGQQAGQYSDAALQQLCKRHGVSPRYVIPTLRW